MGQIVLVVRLCADFVSTVKQSCFMLLTPHALLTLRVSCDGANSGSSTLQFMPYLAITRLSLPTADRKPGLISQYNAN
jgi:hypothetical protein